MWVSSGWWSVSRYDTKRFDLRIFDLDDNNMFFAARCNGRYMKGANEYRVDKQNNFEIIGADRFTSKDETTKFQSVMVGKGDKVVVVNTF